jgi:hypothetical protein
MIAALAGIAGRLLGGAVARGAGAAAGGLAEKAGMSLGASASHHLLSAAQANSQQNKE